LELLNSIETGITVCAHVSSFYSIHWLFSSKNI